MFVLGTTRNSGGEAVFVGGFSVFDDVGVGFGAPVENKNTKH